MKPPIPGRTCHREPHRLPTAIAVLALLAVRPSLCSAQAAPSAEDAVERRPTLRAAALLPGPAALALDGRLDDPAWATSDSIANLITIEPEEGGPTLPPKVKFLPPDVMPAFWKPPKVNQQ